MKFDTQIINGVKKQSCLDHIYSNCTETILSVNQIDPTFGDHLLIHVELSLKDVTAVNYIFKRNWKNFSSEILIEKLLVSFESVTFDWRDLNVQEHWNQLENLVVNIVDDLAPLVPVDDNAVIKNKKVPPFVKNKINVRKRLVKLEKKETLLNLPHVSSSLVN